jgi:hypothetical protein
MADGHLLRRSPCRNQLLHTALLALADQSLSLRRNLMRVSGFPDRTVQKSQNCAQFSEAVRISSRPPPAPGQVFPERASYPPAAELRLEIREALALFDQSPVGTIVLREFHRLDFAVAAVR